VDEIVDRNGVPLIHIRHRLDRPIKGGRSRVIPMHSMLIAIGLPDFVEEQRKAGAVLLFPEEMSNSLDHWGDAVSDWFGRLVRRLELKGRRLSLHSFRHTFEDALREADLHDTPIGNALTGRRSGSVSANFGSRFSTAKLAAAVERVNYGGLCLRHLFAEPQG
jgi:integrase